MDGEEVVEVMLATLPKSDMVRRWASAQTVRGAENLMDVGGGRGTKGAAGRVVEVVGAGGRAVAGGVGGVLKLMMTR